MARSTWRVWDASVVKAAGRITASTCGLFIEMAGASDHRTKQIDEAGEGQNELGLEINVSCFPLC